MTTRTCTHCGEPFVNDKTTDEPVNWCGDEAYGHEGLCCDCMDLSCGMPIGQLNKERAAKGRPPLTKLWPGYDEHGNSII